jgi:hypothetical protein
MSGLDEVDCSGCGRRHVTNGEQARKLRVLRCDCGQFVRLDRALAERRSDSAPPLVEFARARTDEDEDEDDRTHMMSSHAAMAAINGRGRSHSPQPSLVDDERVSRPVQRPSPLRSPTPAPPRHPSIAPTDKPLWYVDLGGTELVEMTIEQLILARRSGKLGEGALVWREGMPSWRPVGTLIPAASASSHPSPAPSASATPMPMPTRAPAAAAIRTPVPTRPPPPKRTPPPAAPEDATPQSLASYERPLATLEFALEKQDATPSLPAPRAPLPSSAALRTPFPRSAQAPLAASLATPMPSPRRSSRPPAPPPVPLASPSPLPPAPVVRTSDRPSQQAQLASLQAAATTSERPRWLSACIALVVCVTASAAGASLVRSLKQPKPQAPPAITAPAPVSNTSTEKPASELPSATASSAPLVVDLESLSVEHKRTPTRAVRAAPKLAPVESTDTSEQTPAKADDAASESAADETQSSSDSPAPARANPYGSGSLIDQIKKATADDEANQ